MGTDGFVILTLEFQKNVQEGVWEGHCRELGTATFAKTFDQVYEELKELVTLHLNGLEEIGERERFFKEHGIRLYKVEPKKIPDLPVPWDSNTLVQRMRLPFHQAIPA